MAFANFALNHVTDHRVVGEMTFGKMPPVAPSEAFNDKVAVAACGNPLRSGWYNFSQLSGGSQSPQPLAPLGTLEQALQTAGFLFVDRHCSPPVPQAGKEMFHKPYKRGASHEFYIRRRGR
jgi:hypothetical protein